MKNKFLKTTLLVSFASSIATVGAISYSIATSNKNEVKAETKGNTVNNNTTVNATTRTGVKFKLSKAQEEEGLVKFTGSTIQGARVGDPFCSIHHPIATFEDRQQDYWIYSSGDKAGERVKDLDPITADMVVYPYFENEVSLKNCLTMVALEHSMVTVINHNGNEPDLKYSTDAIVWNTVTPGSTISVEPNNTLYFKGNNPDGFSQSEDVYTSISIAGTVNLVGNVMTLLDDGKGTTTVVPNKYCFARLFENATGVRVISSAFLPAIGLKPYCYDSMFKGCTSLNMFPTYLTPAYTLAEGCYKEMFAGCTTLDSISPQLLSEAQTLAPYCYQQMFEGCTGLTTVKSGVLPEANFAEGCFTGMFRNCTGLTSINSDLLPAEELAEYCYWGMFSGCKGLTDLSGFKLPATTLEPYCYYDMFYNCTGLTKVPSLPAAGTTGSLAAHCYESMFYNCTGLTDVTTANISLPAAELADGCYLAMFSGSGLTSIPTLGATQLAPECYKDMFRNCASLGDLSSKSLPATTLADHCYETMFYASSVVKGPSFSTSETPTTLADYCCYKMYYKCASLTASPALPATKATSWCYREMFGYCTALTSIGTISINNLGDGTVETPLRQMFDSCSAVRVVLRSEGGSGTAFFNCPGTGSGYTTDKVDNMFQGTMGQIETGYTPSAGQSYKYRAS